jgi:hypothetical protein
MVADAFDFNDHAYRRFVERIKVGLRGRTRMVALTISQDAVDPNGILSPGKQGIWPERYREFREKA